MFIEFRLMRSRKKRILLKSIFAILILCLIFVSVRSYATTHIIQYGGSFFHSYNPSKLTVSVGDTIVWKGNGNSTFIQHSLESDTIPSGAEPFGLIDTGSSFFYVIQVPGYYHYICTEHLRLENMVGSFTAMTSGVDQHISGNTLFLDQNYPNPFNNSTTIRYSLKRNSLVTIKIFNTKGEQICHIPEEYQEAGIHEIPFNAEGLLNGTYFYFMQEGEEMLGRKMTVFKRESLTR